MLLWAQCTLASVRLARGDVTGALELGEAAARDGTQPDLHATGQPGWCLGAALTAAGNPDRAAAVMLEAFGGLELSRVVPSERPAAAADLVEALLAQDDLAAAETTLAHAARSRTPPAVAALGIARAALLLGGERAAEAAAAATAARTAAEDLPFTAARARLVEGRAHAAAGDRAAAIRALEAAEVAFDGFGALRRRDEATRELRRLGRRVLRPAGGSDGDPLTAREREISDLVAAGRTNREVADQLVLSTRTIEAHLRNIYGKLGVRSRVELVHALEAHSSQAPGHSSTPSAKR